MKYLLNQIYLLSYYSTIFEVIMTLSTSKKVVFSLIAITLPILLIEFTSYAIVRIFFPQPQVENKKTFLDKKNFLDKVSTFRTDYSSNDFSKEDYDYTKDFYGPYLHNTSLGLSERLIGPRAVKHYLRISHYTLFPFTMFHVQRNYRSAVINTNHLGFRARELNDYVNDPRPKIIILGGSAIFGTFSTSDEKTLSAQLEAYLRQHGRDVTCINLGMQGYTSEQEMITLNRIGMRFNPSLVIAIDGWNDVIHYSANRDLPQLFPRLAHLYYEGIPPNSSPGTYVKALILKLGQYSSFFYLAGALSSKPWSASQYQYSEKIDNSCLFPERSDEQAIIDNFLNSHFMMFSLCKGRNIGYIAGFQPMCGMWIEPRWEGEKDISISSKKNFVNAFSLLDENLNALAQKEGFPYINFGKILAKEDNLYNFATAVHLTDMSTKIIAQRLGELILAKFSGLIDTTNKSKSQ